MIETIGWNYNVPKAMMPYGQNYHGMGQERGAHMDPGWAGWNPKWSAPSLRPPAGVRNSKFEAHEVKIKAAMNAAKAARNAGANHKLASERAIAAFNEANAASSNNSSSSPYVGEFASSAAEAPAAEEAAADKKNNDSTAEEERAENAGVNSFLSGGSRRRNRRKTNRKNSRR
jgi:hypothetical protein